MPDKAVDILLVEDDPNDEMLALHAFARHDPAGKVRVARDGEEALEFLFCTGAYAGRQFVNPRLVLLDKKLPHMNGIEVLRAIRADPRTRLVPVVMLTASAEDRDVVDSYQLRVNSYVVKPADFAQFSDTVSRVGSYWLRVNRQPSGVACPL